jgi:hypothetical protein
MSIFIMSFGGAGSDGDTETYGRFAGVARDFRKRIRRATPSGKQLIGELDIRETIFQNASALPGKSSCDRWRCDNRISQSHK